MYKIESLLLFDCICKRSWVRILAVAPPKTTVGKLFAVIKQYNLHPVKGRGDLRPGVTLAKLHRPWARFTKYLTITLRLSYDNAKVTISLRQNCKIVYKTVFAISLQAHFTLYAVVKVVKLRWGSSVFSVGPQPWGQGPSDADASEYSMPYLPFFS